VRARRRSYRFATTKWRSGRTMRISNCCIGKRGATSDVLISPRGLANQYWRSAGSSRGDAGGLLRRTDSIPVAAERPAGGAFVPEKALSCVSARSHAEESVLDALPSRGMSKNPRRQTSEFPLTFKRLRWRRLARTDSVQESTADVEESALDVDAGAPPAQESFADTDVIARDVKEMRVGCKGIRPGCLCRAGARDGILPGNVGIGSFHAQPNATPQIFCK
jgi:hypothetical protein